MGRIFLSLDPNIDRKVALKVLQPLRGVSIQDEAGLRRRFVLEARAAGKLNHPGIVAVFDAGTDPATDLAFIAMEWVDGPSLDQILREAAPIPLPQAIGIVEQVATALEVAHREGLVHRDIKPGNILLTADGQAKLSDFGIAKFGSMSITQAGQILGSPYYMSPEQVRNETLDGRTDLYSLGVVLYQCVTGSLPFDGDSLASITFKILEIDPRPPRLLNPDLPQSLARVVEQALAKSPAERFQTGLEFARAVRAADPSAPTGEGTVAEKEAAPPPPVATEGEERPAREGSGTLLLADGVPATAVATGGDTAIGDASPVAENGKRSRVHGLRILEWSPWVSGAVAVAGVAALSLLAIFGPWVSGPTGQSGPGTVTETPELMAPSEEGGVGSDRAGGRAAAGVSTVNHATLEITHKNRLRAAEMGVWIDGERVWSRRLTAPGSILKRASGVDVRANLEIPEGRHLIEIRIDSASGGVHAAKRIEAVFEKGRTRTLKVLLIPPNWLKISWKE